MNVYKCGTEVVLKGVNIKARIISVEISFSNVTYKVSFFEDFKRTTEWLNEEEFSTEDKQTKIGYK